MIWFDYNYTSSSDIIKEIKVFGNFSEIEFAILLVWIILLVSFIFYIIPLLNIYYTFIKKEKEKKKRRVLIKQIATQKDINDEIEKELNI